MNPSFRSVLHDLALHDQSELVRRDSLLFHQRLLEIGDLRSNTMHFILRTVRLPSKLKSRYRNHRETNALTFLPETVYM